MNGQTIDLTIHVTLVKVLDGQEATPNDVGAAVVEQIATRLRDLAVVTPSNVSFYTLINAYFDPDFKESQP